MNVFLWVLQILLALGFLQHGLMMLSPTTSQSTRMPYIMAVPPILRRFIGVAEVIAMVGLILPGLTHILSWLTPLAATGLVILMISAAIFHIPRREYPNIVLNLIFLVMAAIVAYGRFVVVPL
ncbi:MAG TPA: DoxX family protein [Anaerolineales bacterium]|nr:DoxX family protein [Anaerolineales bacterium]